MTKLEMLKYYEDVLDLDDDYLPLLSQYIHPEDPESAKLDDEWFGLLSELHAMKKSVPSFQPRSCLWDFLDFLDLQKAVESDAFWSLLSLYREYIQLSFAQHKRKSQNFSEPYQTRS